MTAGRRWTDRFVVPVPTVVARVDVMTTVAANLDAELSLQRAGLSELVDEPCSCGFALTGHGEAYNEQAFHHFLTIERKRSEASTRPFLLLLVEFEKHLAAPALVDDEVASRLFAALAEALRDTDVIGWYREHRIAGAVLTDLGDGPQAIMPTIADRVRAFLQRRLPVSLASLVQVRLYQLPARTESLADAIDPQVEFA